MNISNTSTTANEHQTSSSLSPNASATAPTLPVENSAYAVLTQCVLLITLGSVTILLNTTTSATIIYTSRLRKRKELLVFCGLLLSDVLYGTSTVAVGVQQLSSALRQLSDSNTTVSSSLVPPAYCFHFYSTFSTLTGTPLVALMLCVVSIDRLLSVSNVKRYQSLQRSRYVTVVTGLPISLVLCVYGTAWYITHIEPSNASRLLQTEVCSTLALVLPGSLFLGWISMQQIASSCSVLVYSVVLMLYKRRTSQLHSMLRQQQQTVDSAERRQLQMTKTVGFICLGTLILVVVPEAVVLYLAYISNGPPQNVEAGIIAARMSISSFSFANVCIFLSQPGDVRSQIASLLRKLCCGKGTTSGSQHETKEQQKLPALESIATRSNQEQFPAAVLYDLEQSSAKDDANCRNMAAQLSLALLQDPLFGEGGSALRYIKITSNTVHVVSTLPDVQ